MIKLQVYIIPPRVQNAEFRNLEIPSGGPFQGDMSMQQVASNNRSFIPGSTLNGASTPLQQGSIGYKIDPMGNMSAMNPYVSRMGLTLSLIHI